MTSRGRYLREENRAGIETNKTYVDICPSTQKTTVELETKD